MTTPIAGADSQPSQPEAPGRAVSPGMRFGWSIALALLVIVYIEGLLWTLTRIFILNFDVAGPNATLLLFVLLSTGWILAVPARSAAARGRMYLLSIPLLLGGLALSVAPSPLIAGVGAVLLVTAATIPIVGLFDALGEGGVYGIAIGLVLTVGLRVGLDTASPYATDMGTVLLGSCTLGAAVLLGLFTYRESVPETDWKSLGVRPAVPCTLLIVAAGFLVHPQAVALWALRSYEFSVLAFVAGIGAGLLIVQFWRRPTSRETVGWMLLFLGSALGLVYLSHELTTLLYAVAWASALVLLAAGARGATSGSPAVPTTLFQFGALFILFLTVAATHWAFLVFPLDLTRGLGTELTVLFIAIFPLSVGYAIYSADTQTQPAPVEPSRRSALAAVGAGLLPLAGLLANRSDPGVAGPREDRIRVMAYNLHLFFDGESSGQYSLEALRETIAADGADIVAVSESDGLRPSPGYVDGLRWLGNELGYHVEFGAAARRRSYGVGLLSRWPIEDAEVIELPIGRSLTRLAVTAIVQTPSGPLPVVSTHFMVEKESAADDTRAQQAHRVVDRLSAYDQAVAMGDFNIEPDEPEYDILASQFDDAWVTASEAGVARGSGETYSAADPTRRIDYIFLQGEWTIHEATTTGSGAASDHKAVVAELTPDAELDGE